MFSYKTIGSMLLLKTLPVLSSHLHSGGGAFARKTDTVTTLGRHCL